MTLLDGAFVRELEVLRRRLEVRARSGAGGDHLAPRRGSSAEFREHRPYAPGDDLRRIDWAAYARSGEPVLKLFRAEEDVVVRIVCDASASLDFGTPNKLAVARRLSAAMGYLALAAGERAELAVAQHGVSRPEPSARGRGALAGLFRALEALEAAGPTDLARAVDGAVRRAARPGALVVVSDFLDSGAVMAALARAATAGHDVMLVHVVAPDEIEPDLAGDVVLEDAESGALVELTLDAGAVEAYALRFAGLCEELARFARRRGGVYVRVRSDEPLEGAVRRVVERSTQG